MAESHEYREKRQVTLSLGSLFMHRKLREPFLVFDVGIDTSPIRACQIVNADTNRVYFPESLGLGEIGAILDVWPESRIIEAFSVSYGFPRAQIIDVLSLVPNRGPRTFEF